MVVSMKWKFKNTQYLTALFFSILLFLTYSINSFLNLISVTVFILIAVILIIWPFDTEKDHNWLFFIIILILFLFIYMSLDFIITNYAY